jgi:hypothetical protein
MPIMAADEYENLTSATGDSLPGYPQLNVVAC